jgi:hypothetical protein
LFNLDAGLSIVKYIQHIAITGVNAMMLHQRKGIDVIICRIKIIVQTELSNDSIAFLSCAEFLFKAEY